MNRWMFVFSVLLVVFTTSCKRNSWDIDIADIKIQQNYFRFEKDLFAINKDSIWNYVPDFEKKYGNYYDLFNKGIIKIGGINQLDYADKLYYFITDPYIAEAYKQGTLIFTPEIKGEIHSSFCRYHYYFPERVIPDIYTHISGFNQSLVVDSALISISLDRYLGRKSKFYKMLRTPMYLRYNMYPEKIPSDVIYAWGVTEFVYNDSVDNLINQMVYYGTIHLFMDAILPNTPDTIKWGISPEKLKWCKKNEREMWLYLVENKLLFSTDYIEIKRFIDNGPFTTPFSRKSPSRTGQWLGYRIVKSYMKNNNVTLQELMSIDDYQMIFNKSRYKP